MTEESADRRADAASGGEPQDRPPLPAADATPKADATPPTGVDPDVDSGVEPSESVEESEKSLRPLDWDGSFSRTWNAGMSEQWANQRAAEQEREWEEEELRQSLQEARDRMNAESAQAEARAREERRGPSSAGGGGRESARDRLARKLDKLDRLSDVDSDESGDAR